MSRLAWILLLAALGAAGQWRAAAVLPPPTNHVSLTWGSLGPGTRYYVQTSTDLLTWTEATDTVSTNANLAFTGDSSRTFRVWASNAPPQSATVAWDPGAPLTNITGYFLYYGAAAASYTNRIDVGLATSAAVSNLLAGTIYYFAATAYSSSGLESDFSNEVLWRCPLRIAIQRLP